MSSFVRRFKTPFAQACLLLIGVLCLANVSPAQFAHAQTTTQTADDIQTQIDQHNAAIDELNAEIASYQSQLNVVSGQKQTLQTAISSIDLSRKQTQTQAQVTQNQLAATDLTLTQIKGDISTKEQLIALDQNAVAKSLRDLQEADATSVVEQIFAADSLTDAWTDADDLATVNDALRSNVGVLSGDKVQLAGKQDDAAANRTKLADLQTQLVTQQKALDANKAAKASLLAQTKNQESTYQSLIAQKQAQEKAFEAEISALQASLAPVTATQIPTVGQGVLAWPFSPTFASSCLGKASALGNNFCITQYFGNTPFATANPSVYNGMGHDGIDIGMPVGTPVQAALAGTVLAVGNTDIKSPSGQMCYSFGKWVMLSHANGISTLYAHLSDNTIVTKGQAVATGQVIGYSGMTGYATGPHLHFGVYASAGVQIMDLGKWRGSGGTPCTDAGAVLPVAPDNAYLNPMSYL